MLDRRALLKSALYTAPVFTAGRLYAAPTASMRLLVVFLRGAYDATNIVVPVSSSFYYESRKTIAIPKNAALPLDSDWGLHPALKDTIYPLWQNKQVAFVPFAGTDDLTRSHFETQDTIELGQPISVSRDYRSGFMSRTASVLTGSVPIAFTAQLPLTFRGGAAISNVALNTTATSGVQGREFAPAAAQGFEVRNDVYNAISSEMMAANRNAVATRGFELSAQRIGSLMKNRFNLGFIDVGGWDTHVNQGGVDGYLANRIGELGRGLAALSGALGEKWNDTVVIVVSEFGRTFRENGDRGTDHGHGSTYWVLGGGIKGGRIAGPQVAVTHANLFQDRDWPVLTDYRALIGGMLKRSYGLSQAQLIQIFPQASPADLALV
ncbi:MAG TPA: DUF1501 domain-containing protein [Rhizomicrobium sp.]|jgi:uncharacterized protein (DUF1501 family)